MGRGLGRLLNVRPGVRVLTCASPRAWMWPSERETGCRCRSQGAHGRGLVCCWSAAPLGGGTPRWASTLAPPPLLQNQPSVTHLTCVVYFRHLSTYTLCTDFLMSMYSYHAYIFYVTCPFFPTLQVQYIFHKCWILPLFIFRVG
jgi:hypothetical protein